MTQREANKKMLSIIVNVLLSPESTINLWSAEFDDDGDINFEHPDYDKMENAKHAIGKVLLRKLMKLK